jgi:hypothetical protein
VGGVDELVRTDDAVLQQVADLARVLREELAGIVGFDPLGEEEYGGAGWLVRMLTAAQTPSLE